SGLGKRLGDTPQSIGWSMKTRRRGGRAHTLARAALVLLRSRLQTVLLTKAWLALLSQRGTSPGGRNGEGNSAVGVMGINPAPIPGIPRYSAADKPTNDASADSMMASQPFPAATTSRSHSSVLALVMRVRSRMVSAGLVSFPGRSTFWISPASGVDAIPSAAALPRVTASANSRTSCPASMSARQRAASGRVSPSVPYVATTNFIIFRQLNKILDPREPSHGTAAAHWPKAPALR